MSPGRRLALVPDMHEFLGKSTTDLSLTRRRSATTRRCGRCPRRSGREMSKSFAVRGFRMLSPSLELNSLVESGRLHTLTGSFSTQADTRFQLRDLIFISSYSAGSYLTTGVESRSSVAFAPTNPNRTRAPRTHRRIEKARSLFVSRLS